MPLTLTDRQAARIATALRQGALDSFRIADALDAGHRTHILIEVSDMGQFAKDWDTLKKLIKDKDDALDRQAAQLATQGQQLANLQQQLSALQQRFDSDDQKAIAEVHQAIVDNAPGASSAAPATPAAQKAGQAVTTFTK